MNVWFPLLEHSVDFVPNPNCCLPYSVLHVFWRCFFPKVMDPSRKPPELAPFWVTETESNASMDDGWMKLSAIDPNVCVCGFGYMLTYSNCSFQEGQHNRKLVGRLIYEYCADMVQFQLESHVLIMSWWRILWEDPGCLWYAAMARQMLQAFLYKGTQLGTKAKTAITNVRNCHVHPSPILHHVAVDCSTANTSCILMSFSLQFSIISRFPSKKNMLQIFQLSTPTPIPSVPKTKTTITPPNPHSWHWHHRWPGPPPPPPLPIRFVSAGSQRPTHPRAERSLEASETCGKIQDGWDPAAGCPW